MKYWWILAGAGWALLGMATYDIPIISWRFAVLVVAVVFIALGYVLEPME